MEQKSEMRFPKLKDGLQIILLIFGTSWGIYTFIYKDIWVPAKRPPAVTLAATLEELDRSEGMILIRARLAVANRGDAKVWVPALWWNVYGVSFDGADRTRSEFVSHGRPLLQKVSDSASRFSNIRSAEIVAARYQPEFETWYQPKDETVHEQLFLVPEDRFDALQIYVSAIITKSIDMLAPTSWEMKDNGELTPALWLKEKGWDKDPSRVVRFAPEADRGHRIIFDREDAGHNITTASLRLKPKSLATTPDIDTVKASQPSGAGTSRARQEGERELEATPPFYVMPSGETSAQRIDKLSPTKSGSPLRRRHGASGERAIFPPAGTAPRSISALSRASRPPSARCTAPQGFPPASPRDVRRWFVGCWQIATARLAKI
jgi:hypothetical protein